MTNIRALFLCFLLVAPPTAGQDAPLSSITIDDADAAARISSEITAVESLQGLDAEMRTSILGQLRDAATLLQSKLDADAAAESFVAALDSAPAETGVLRAALEEEAPAPETVESLGIDDSVSLPELQQWLAKETADLTAIDSAVSELNAQIESEINRPAVARERIGQLRASREELSVGVEEPVAVGEQQLLLDATKVATQFRRAAHGAEINKLEQELLSNAVRLELLRAKLDMAKRSQVALQQRADLLRAAVNERQQLAEQEAQQAAIAAETAAAAKHPVIRSLAEDNAALAVTLPVGAAEIEEASSQLVAVEEKKKHVAERHARSRQHIDIGGLSRTTGRLLIDERSSLNQVVRYRERDAELSEIGLALMIIQDEQRDLASLDDRVQELVAELDQEALLEEEIASIVTDVRSLLQSRRDLLARAENNYRSYLQVLGDLNKAQGQLLGSVEDYKNFLNQSLLWIPSAPVAFDGTWSDLAASVKRAVSPAVWREIFSVLVEALREQAVLAGIFLLLLGLLVAARSSLTSLNNSFSRKVGRLSTDHIGLTLGSLATATARVMPLPFLFLGSSWFLGNAVYGIAFNDAVTSSDALARSLFLTAPFLFNTLMLRVLSAPDGVFSKHFGWNPDNLALMRRQLGLLAIGGTPQVLILVFVFASEDASDHTYLGRLLFVVLMLFLAFVTRPLVHARTGLAAGFYKRRPESWLSKLRWVWHSTAVGVPLALSLISIQGNVYTSTKLAGLFVDTVWLGLALVIVYMVVLRWLALSRRKLQLKILLQKREAQKAEREASEQPDAETEAPAVASESLDLDAVDHQSKKLLRWGLVFVAAIAIWQTWSEVLPAFTLLEGVNLWSKVEMIDGVETMASVTLADLVLAFLVILAAMVAARNLPGFIEIAIPRHLAVERGSRYAINTLVRYFIIMAGVVAVLNIVGWRWSQIQWLVAALSVGLGFGLQEIVANFVSGLVILFERPVRVGDTITVGQLSGTVTRIRIRATTIVDWDRKEIIVPNKSFITEQVVNWTLTDPIIRIVIPVGVSYGSDVGQVHKVISDTLPALQLVLDEPAPRVYFAGFGDSSLDFDVHVYLRHMTDRMPLIHEVHSGILEALRENGIEIPFPQRDLHIRSTVEGKKEE